MYISNVDIEHERNEAKKVTHRPKTDPNKTCTSNPNSQNDSTTGIAMAGRLRKRGATSADLHEEEEEEVENNSDIDYHVRDKPIAGKCYEKVHIYSVSDDSFILADRRMTSLRQQSDQLISVVDRHLHQFLHYIGGGKKYG